MKRLVMLAGAILLTVSHAGAQSMPNVSGAKRAAQNAAGATNRHTATVTADQSAKEKPVRRDTANAVRPEASAGTPATTPKTVRGTVAGKTARPVETDTTGQMSFRRETYAYESGGRRDPFFSLMTSGEIRPMISDLRLVGVLTERGSPNSVAILRDVSSDEQYRVRVGQSLGRLRVAHIAQKAVTFTVEEFGFSRQQVLALSDSTQARTK